MRVGLGYDSHRFRAAGGTLTLGGAVIPHPRGLAGHSDADVLLHALADALLSAIAAPDIGELFPPSDARYRDAASRRFVERAVELMRAASWRVANLSAVVIADEPTLAPHKAAIRASLGVLVGVDAAAVGLSAKTTEGFPPGRDGIAAQVVVLLERA